MNRFACLTLAASRFCRVWRPLGKPSVRRGFGPCLCPGIAISLALLNLKQSTAQIAASHFSIWVATALWTFRSAGHASRRLANPLAQLFSRTVLVHRPLAHSFQRTRPVPKQVCQLPTHWSRSSRPAPRRPGRLNGDPLLRVRHRTLGHH